MKKLIALLLLISCNSFAQISEKQVDELVENTLKSFNVPGIAVAIVKDGKVVLSKGYGIKSILTKEKVDANTLFGIASNSKAFTTTALAMLVDEKKINWDDKVTQYLPDFKMYNEYVTQEFTIRDLVTHRSGLGLGAGDLMIWPDGSDFTTTDIIHNLQYLKPVSAFRTKYDYDNLLYIVAGEVIAKVSGKSWCNFIEERIMKPLEMNHSAASFVRLKDTTNVIAPHVPTDGKLKIISRYKNQTFDAAAGIYSNVNDLSKWMIVQLQNGKYGPENQLQLFSKKEQNEMWSLQTIIPANTKPPYNTHFSGYGLGWFLSDVKGYKEVTHTGGLEGIVTQTTLFPELNLGIVVLTNQQSGAAFSTITNSVKDAYLKVENRDWLKLYGERSKKNDERFAKQKKDIYDKASKYKLNLKDDQFIGWYKDEWFGIVEVSKVGKAYRIISKSSPRLKGDLIPYSANSFVVKWDDRSYDADVFFTLNFDENGKAVSAKMKPISDVTDFSFDFEDLDLKKVN